MKKKDIQSGVTATNPDEIRLGLSRMRKLLEVLGDPQEKLKIVHVAGTNGKGTVIAFLETVLRKDAKRKVGTYTTPAVFSPYEVLRVNGKNITPSRLRKLTEEVDAVCATHFPKEDAPTPFERLTAKAFLYFEREGADIVLLETGMGGDLDATNAYEGGSQLCAVLTSVGEDHMDFLGNTTEQIAMHKAGIFRGGRPVILGSAIPKDARAVVSAAAKALHCPVRDSRNVKPAIEDIPLKMAGAAAADNACCAYACLLVLRSMGFTIDDKQIRTGLSETVLPGRFEIVPIAKNRQKIVILDGAHNLPAAKSWANNVKSAWKDYKKIVVCGILKDKDYPAILRQIASIGPDSVYFGATRGKRGLPAVTLSEAFAKEEPSGQCKVFRFCSVKKAFTEAYAQAETEKGKVLLSVLGSFTTLEAVRKVVIPGTRK